MIPLSGRKLEGYEERRAKIHTFENGDARRYFRLYNELHRFVDEQDYNASDVVERLKMHTLQDAAAVIHDAFMELEYGER
jgi:hypothetical protein